MVSRHAHAFVWIGLVALLTGCPDPDVEFADFEERYKAVKGGDGGSGQGGAMACTPAMPGELDGEWLFALTPKQSMTKPAPLLATLTTTDSTFSFDMQPLDAEDRVTEVGSSFPLGPFDYAADGSFEADWGTIMIPGETNPLTDSALTANVVISGSLCAGDFLCGRADGQVTMPVMLGIDDSNWSMTRMSAYEEPPVLDCAGNTAAPL